jgi:uncharacterized protein with HEPN domain
MTKNPLAPLTDIQDAIRRIERYTEAETGTSYETNELVRDAVERCVEIISEASRRIPAELKARHRDIPWPQIAAIGNVLRHEYKDVEATLMWKVAKKHVPALKRAVAAMIRETKKTAPKK